MNIKQMINSPDFKNLILGIQLNSIKKELRALSDFYTANLGKKMLLSDFQRKIEKVLTLDGIEFLYHFEYYDCFDNEFNERLAECFGIKIYYKSDLVNNTSNFKINNGMLTMGRIISGVGLFEFIQKFSADGVHSYKSALSCYKSGLPF